MTFWGRGSYWNSSLYCKKTNLDTELGYYKNKFQNQLHNCIHWKRKAYCHILMWMYLGCREIVRILLLTLAGVMHGTAVWHAVWSGSSSDEIGSAICPTYSCVLMPKTQSLKAHASTLSHKSWKSLLFLLIIDITVLLAHHCLYEG